MITPALALFTVVSLAVEVEPEAGTSVRSAAIIPIHGEIDSLLLQSLERRVDAAKARGATLLVFDFDTPGGELRAMLDIGDLVFSQPDGVKTVAYVSREALSAGAFIAFACREIVMAPSAIMGDCEPIFMSPSGGIETAEKFQSPIRAEFRKFAERHGYPVALVEAMVTKEAEVVQIRMSDSDEVIYADRTEFDRWPDDMKKKATAKVVVKEGQLLTLHASEALEYGLSKATLDDVDDVLDHYGAEKSAPRLEETWSEEVAAFLQNPALRFLLFVVGLLGLYLEFKTPGFGVFGIVGIVCLLLLFGSSYIAGLAEVWEILLFGAGVALLLVEIFVLPGFGVAGIAGILLILVSLYLSALPFVVPDRSSPLRYEIEVSMVKGWLVQFAAGILSLVVAGGVLAKLLPKIPMMNRLVLAPEAGTAVHGSAVLSGTDERVGPGATGVAVTPLRPAGTAKFGGRRLDVVTEGDFVDAGETVVVLASRGSRTVVAREKRA